MNKKITWNDFDEYSDILETYLPDKGEGDTMASQICTACSKIIYKYFNDGDYIDTLHKLKRGYSCNDIASFGNWLAAYTDCGFIINRMYTIKTDYEYRLMLFDLAKYFTLEKLEEYNKKEKAGSVYDCVGGFGYDENDCDEVIEDEYYIEDEDEEDEE